MGAKELIAPGGTVTVEGYQNRGKLEEMRAERITAGGKTLHYTVSVFDSVIGDRDTEDGMLSQIVRDLDEAVEKSNP